MCVAVPGKITWVGETTPGSIPGIVQVGDHTRDVNLVMIPEAGVGDWVISHSGFAIRRLSRAEAAATHGILDSAGLEPA